MNCITDHTMIVLIGTFESGATTALQPLVKSETSIVGSQMYTVKDFEAAMSSMATEASASLYSKLLSESFYSLDAVGAAFEEARNPVLGAKVQIEI